jgi:hypothetical protein
MDPDGINDHKLRLDRVRGSKGKREKGGRPFYLYIYLISVI